MGDVTRTPPYDRDLLRDAFPGVISMGFYVRQTEPATEIDVRLAFAERDAVTVTLDSLPFDTASLIEALKEASPTLAERAPPPEVQVDTALLDVDLFEGFDV